MLSSHLACEGSTEPVSPFLCGLRKVSVRRQVCDFRTDSRAPRPLRFRLAGSYTNLNNRNSVARRHVVGGIAQSLHGYRAEAAR